MSPSSLRLRLLLAWAVFIVLVLQVAAVGLRVLFERSITRRTVAELEFDLRQLTRGLKMGSDGTLEQTRRPTDPQFELINGGRYWQVSVNDTVLLRSTSLGENSFAAVDSAQPSSNSLVSSLIAPDGKPLFGLVRQHTVEPMEGKAPLGITVVSAVNAAEIKEDTDKFSQDLYSGLIGLAFLLLAGAWLHVTVGLAPLKQVRASIASIRAGESRRIEAQFPAELMPLVEETNGLLDAQERVLEAARSRAGDLAHGLKTPLAIMAAKSRMVRQSGATTIADEIDHQVEMMRRHVQRELARARARGKRMGGAGHLDLTTATQELVSALQTLPRARMLEWRLDVDRDLGFPVDRADYNDILGNLVDNAQKWAKGRVDVAVNCRKTSVSIVVEDDGPGVDDSLIDQISERGVKVDNAKEGSGLGLAIVGDIVELYGGSVKLGRSALGGLKIEVSLPGQTSRITGQPYRSS